MISGNINFDNKTNTKTNLKIDKYNIDINELNKIILYIQNKHCYNINIPEINHKIKQIILNEILINIKIDKKYSSFNTKEIIHKIITNKHFITDKKFSIKLYQKFITQNNLNEFKFQKKLLLSLKIKKIKNGINYICINETNQPQLKTTYKQYSSNNMYINLKQPPNKLNQFYFNQIEKPYNKNITNISFINISFKTISKHTFISKNKIKKLYQKNIHLYQRINTININHLFLINKNTHLNKNIKTNIKNILNNNKLININLYNINKNIKIKNNKHYYLIDNNKTNINILKINTFKNKYTHNINKVKQDIINKYIKNNKIKYINHIKHNYVKTKENKKIKYINHNFNLKIITLNLNPYIEYNKIQLSNLFNKHKNTKLINFNKNNIIFFEKHYINKKPNLTPSLITDLNLYFNNIIAEQTIIKNIIKLKKTKSFNILLNSSIKININIPRIIKRYKHNITHDILKYKNHHYIIHNTTNKLNDNSNNNNIKCKYKTVIKLI